MLRPLHARRQPAGMNAFQPSPTVRAPGPRPGRGLCIAAGRLVAALALAYALVLALGLWTLPSPSHAIQDPWFTCMELLILGVAPAMLAFTVGVHGWVPARNQPVALLGVVFMGMCVSLTSVVHFCILVLARLPAFAGPQWSAVFAFEWPSLAYALDILAWDALFAAGAACVAAALRGVPGFARERGLFLAAAVLAAAGLAGIPLADMAVRNVGIAGYALLFPLAAALCADKLARAAPLADH